MDKVESDYLLRISNQLKSANILSPTILRRTDLAAFRLSGTTPAALVLVLAYTLGAAPDPRIRISTIIAGFLSPIFLPCVQHPTRSLEPLSNTAGLKPLARLPCTSSPVLVCSDSCCVHHMFLDLHTRYGFHDSGVSVAAWQGASDCHFRSGGRLLVQFKSACSAGTLQICSLNLPLTGQAFRLRLELSRATTIIPTRHGRPFWSFPASVLAALVPSILL